MDRSVDMIADMAATNPFDDLADTYDSNGMHAARAAALVQLAASALADDPRLILDVATGTGAAAFAALQRFPHSAITAVDLSTPMINRARQLAAGVTSAERIEWLSRDALPFPAPDAEADLVLCASSLHFFPAAVFDDWARLLRPGGVAAYTLPLRSTFTPGPMFADLLPDDEARIPLPDNETEAGRLAGDIRGFTPVGAEITDGVASFVLRKS